MFPMAAITNYYKLSGLKLHKTSDIVAEVRSLKWVYWVKKSRCWQGRVLLEILGEDDLL